MFELVVEDHGEEGEEVVLGVVDAVGDVVVGEDAAGVLDGALVGLDGLEEPVAEVLPARH